MLDLDKEMAYVALDDGEAPAFWDLLWHEVVVYEVIPHESHVRVRVFGFWGALGGVGEVVGVWEVEILLHELVEGEWWGGVDGTFLKEYA